MSIAQLQRVLIVGAAALVIAACSFVPKADAFRFEMVQLGRFSIDSKRFIHRNFYTVHRGQIRLKYDERYRPPFSPAGPAVFDCATAKTIGVSFQLKRSNRLSSENVPWDVVWRQEGSDQEVRIDAHTHQTVFWPKGSDRLLQETLALWNRPEWRRDGLITLEIKLRGRVLLENSFQLVGC